MRTKCGIGEASGQKESIEATALEAVCKAIGSVTHHRVAAGESIDMVRAAMKSLEGMALTHIALSVRSVVDTDGLRYAIASICGIGMESVGVASIEGEGAHCLAVVSVDV